MAAPKKGVHEGHRKRLLDLVTDVGLERVSRIQAMEFILTYIFPRGDVNELAHRLLDRFGTAADVMNAEPELLKEVEGMGERSAKALHALVDIFEYYTEVSIDRRYTFEYRSDIADYFEELLRFRRVEMSYIVGIDPGNKVKMKYLLATGGLKGVGVNLHEIAKFVTSVKPAYVFLAHNHPGGCAKPSQADLTGTQMVESLLESLGIPLVDHVIVGADGVYSVKGKEFYSEFRV